MNKIICFSAVILVFFMSVQTVYSNNGPVSKNKVFTVNEIKVLADAYVNNNLGLKNPAIADVDGDGNFDILIFNNGNVEYYRNTGTLEKPFFVPENMHYDKYSTAFFFKGNLPYPIFFADKNGDGKPDMFVVKDKIEDINQTKSEYKVLYAENVLGLDTGTLVTIILVLVIVLLVLAIIH
jgi:hypothetical protein